MKYILIPLLLAAALAAHPTGGACSEADKPEPLTLDAAIEVALEKNPRLAAMRRGIEAAEGKIKQARLIPNPRIEFNAEEVPARGMDIGKGQNTLGISQLFETGGKRKLRTEVARKGKAVAELEYETLALNIVYKTKRAFYEVLAASEGLKIAEETLTIARKLEDAAGKRLEAGDVPRIEVFKAGLEVARAINDRTSAETELLNAQNRLFTVIGEPDIQPVTLVGTLYTETPPLSFDNLRTYLLQDHPLLEAKRKGIELADTRVKQVGRDVIPDLDISAGYGRDGGAREDIAQFGIEVPFPIFNRNQGKVAESKALAKKAERDYKASCNSLLLQLNQTLSTYNAQSRQVEVFIKEILPRAEQSLNLSTEGYQEGEFSYLDVLDAQRTLAQAKASYVSTLKGLNVTISALEKLICREITDLPF